MPLSTNSWSQNGVLPARDSDSQSQVRHGLRQLFLSVAFVHIRKLMLAYKHDCCVRELWH